MTVLFRPALFARITPRISRARYVGRASGGIFDARKAIAYAPYDKLDFAVPVLSAGDVNARVWIRIREVEQSFSLIDQTIERLPGGPIAVSFEARGAGKA